MNSSRNRCTTMKTMIAVVVTLLASPPARADVTLEDIIENVRRNEALYENLDVKLSGHYTIGDREPGRMLDGGNAGDTET
jgi:hypothetical protein